MKGNLYFLIDLANIAVVADTTAKEKEPRHSMKPGTILILIHKENSKKSHPNYRCIKANGSSKLSAMVCTTLDSQHVAVVKSLELISPKIIC